ncbi:MAG: ATP-binding cassette domain-containing protein [Alicyclobacillus sp.]|nr:ATP-binding cassette domain-containing protein [Alicyclobacillus sp.]
MPAPYAKAQTTEERRARSEPLQLHGVTVVLRRGVELVHALQPTTLRLSQSQWTAVIGRNGSGKSTLGKVLAGLSSVSRGEVVWPQGAQPADIRMLLQNADAQIVGSTIEEDLRFGLEVAGRAAPADRMLGALKQVGLDKPLSTPVSTLSGGERQLLVLAGAVVTQPQWLICDEITAHLDRRTQTRVQSVVEGLRQRGVGIVWITQRLEELAAADRVLALEDGAVVFDGTPRTFFRSAWRPLGFTPPPPVHLSLALERRGFHFPWLPLTTRELVNALADHPDTPPRELHPAQRAVPCGGGAAQPPAEPVDGDATRDRGVASGPTRPADEPGFTCHGVTVTAPRRPGPLPSVLLDDVHLDLQPGAVTLVVGLPGAGKTTLLRTLAGLVVPTAGNVTCDGRSVLQRGRPDMRVLGDVEVVFQAPERLFFRPTLAAEFAYALRAKRVCSAQADRRARSALESVGLADVPLSAPPFDLSGGQQRRAALALAAAAEGRWYLLDEPTAGLDPVAVDAVVRWVDHLAHRSGAGVVLSTHDPDHWLPIVDSVVFLAHGRVVAHLPASALRADSTHWAAAGLEPPASLELAAALTRAGWPVPSEPVPTVDTLAEHICSAVARTAHPDAREDVARPVTTALDADVGASRVVAETGPGAGGVALSNLDPRVKWLGVLLLSVAVLSTSLPGVAVAIAVCAGLLAWARISLRTVWRLARVFLVFAVSATAFAGLTLAPGAGKVPWWGRIDWSSSHALTTGFSLLRVLVVLVLGVVFTEATSPLQMKRGLEQGLRWLAPLRVPVQAISFGASLVLRFIPLLAAEAERLAEIVQVRGKRSGKPGRVRLRDAPRVVVPMLFSVFRLGEELSFAMEARGLRTLDQLPLASGGRLSRRDVVAIAAAAAMAALVAGLRLIP